MSRRGARQGGTDDFIAEAAEIVEQLHVCIAELETGLGSGTVDAARLNDVFRAAHSLKGLAGIFGVDSLVGLAHECQQEDKIPCENWDVALDYIATDTALYRCRGE